MAPEFNWERNHTADKISETLGPECLQDVVATPPKGYKEESNFQPKPINEGEIFIENHTTHVLHVTIHGENETESVVGPKQAGECTRSYLTIHGNFVHVTIRNNSYRELCCGWEKNSLSIEATRS